MRNSLSSRNSFDMPDVGGASSTLGSTTNTTLRDAVPVTTPSFQQQQLHRVLIYSTCYNVLDGVTLTIRKLEEELLNAGHQVCILTTVSGDPKNTDLVTAGMAPAEEQPYQHPNRRVVFMDNAIPIPFLQDPNDPELTYQIGFSLSRAVKRKLADFNPTIIHITCPDCTALHLIQYARTHEIPIMGTYHSNIPEYMDHYPGLSWLKHILGGFFRHQYNFLQALYVPTPYIQRHLIDVYKMDKATSLGVWGRGVDCVKFNPRHRSYKFRQSLGIEDDTVIVLWVGRLVPEKRVDIFADTVRRLAAAAEHDGRIRFRAVVVGAGPAQEEIAALPNTTFCGWMNAEQLSVAYASSDVFLFPSSVETFGNVTLEAMASGLPVVVESGCSGHLVNHGRNGYACAAADADAFFEATYHLVVNHADRLKFSETGRHMSEMLEKSAVVRQMFDNYDQVCREFYHVYGGKHANRDAAYRHEHSFVAGNHPRPFLLVAVECLFIVLFQVLWNMFSFFVYMQQSMLSLVSFRRDQSDWHAATTKAAAGEPASPARNTATTDLAPSSPARNTAKEGHQVVLPPALTSNKVELTNLHDMSKSRDGDLENPPSRSTSLASESLSSSGGDYEDETEEEDEDESMDPLRWSNQSLPLQQEQVKRKSFSFGDCQISHALSKGFIRSMELQMRMESHLRNTVARAFTCPLKRPKRKNTVSFNGVQVMDDNDFEMEELLRNDRRSVRPEIMTERKRDDGDELYVDPAAQHWIQSPSEEQSKRQSRLRRTTTASSSFLIV